MFDSASPSDIVTFLQRIDPTVLTNRNPLEAWNEFLKKNGGIGGSTSEREANWMNGKVSGNKGNNDKIEDIGNSKGYSGTKGDKVRRYLKESATQ